MPEPFPSPPASLEVGDSTPMEATEADPRVPLRLTVTRGRLGMELYEPVALGPLVVERLATSFRGLAFPVDLSGGVPVFRHRRGQLEQVVIGCDLGELARWAEPRLRAVWGNLSRPLDVWRTPGGLGVGLVQDNRAVAWDLLFCPEGDTAQFVVHRARGVGLDGAALGEVLRLLDSLVGGAMVREGRRVCLPHVAKVLSCSLLPAVGARVPATDGIVFGPIETGPVLRVRLDTTFGPCDSSAEALSALGLARLCRDGDDALAAGDVELARRHYLSVLENAPRQPELVLLVAEIDVTHGARLETAMGMITETMPLLSAGLIGARLLQARGEGLAARDAYAAAAATETYPPLAGLVCLGGAVLDPDILSRTAALDAAVSRAPTVSAIRWVRCEARARRGDVDGALADAEQLEACSTGAAQRSSVSRRAGELLRQAGFERQAGALFQRALRYSPDDTHALVGFAECLIASGEGRRAVVILERVLALREPTAERCGDVLLLLARLLATTLGDLPQAIAKLRRVPVGDPDCVAARCQEARYRVALGDLLGASAAYGVMRELLALHHSWHEGVAALKEAARFERDVLRDLSSAAAHLSTAIGLCPHDEEAEQAYRAVSAALAAHAARERAAREP